MLAHNLRKDPKRNGIPTQNLSAHLTQEYFAKAKELSQMIYDRGGFNGNADIVEKGIDLLLAIELPIKEERIARQEQQLKERLDREAEEAKLHAKIMLEQKTIDNGWPILSPIEDKEADIKKAFPFFKTIQKLIRLIPQEDGLSFAAMCPFCINDDRTCFRVDPSKQIFKCRCCKIEGDIIDFAMKLRSKESREEAAIYLRKQIKTSRDI